MSSIDVVIYNEKTGSLVYSLSGKIDESILSSLDSAPRKWGNYIFLYQRSPLWTQKHSGHQIRDLFHDYYVLIGVIY